MNLEYITGCIVDKCHYPDGNCRVKQLGNNSKDKKFKKRSDGKTIRDVRIGENQISPSEASKCQQVNILSSN